MTVGRIPAAMALALALACAGPTGAAPPEAAGPLRTTQQRAAIGKLKHTPGEAYVSMGYGVFMHYGLATFVGQTPWQYDPHEVPATVYDPPESFDPDQWMRAIKASGAKYIIFTTKHHDGFVMWPSDYSTYGVATSSDPNTDVVGEVVAAARNHDLKVVLYYSWYDKLAPGGDVRPQDPGSDRTTDSPVYMTYVKNHLRELLTEYGPIAGIWLDIAPLDDVQLPELADYVHAISPRTAFVPNFPNALLETDAADVRTFEGPSEMMPCGYTGKPAEQAYNVAAGPGWWQATDDPPTRDVEHVYSDLSEIRAMGGAFSLNVSPGPLGLLPPASVGLLEALGDRMRGEALLAEAGDAPRNELIDGPLVYDDGARRCGTDGAIRYVGSWSADNWSGAYADTRHYARAPGAYAELSFEGTSVAVMTQTRPGHGITAISIDGGPAERVDTYSDPAQEQVVVWQTNGLTSGIHTIRVTVTGAQNDAAINNWVGLDAIIVRP